MNILKSIIRATTLLLLGIIAMALFFNTESDADQTRWTLHVLLDKSLAIAIFLLLHRLFKRWATIDSWLNAYNRFCKKSLEGVNPTHHAYTKED